MTFLLLPPLLDCSNQRIGEWITIYTLFICIATPLEASGHTLMCHTPPFVEVCPPVNLVYSVAGKWAFAAFYVLCPRDASTVSTKTQNTARSEVVTFQLLGKCGSDSKLMDMLYNSLEWSVSGWILHVSYIILHVPPTTSPPCSQNQTRDGYKFTFRTKPRPHSLHALRP